MRRWAGTSRYRLKDGSERFEAVVYEYTGPGRRRKWRFGSHPTREEALRVAERQLRRMEGDVELMRWLMIEPWVPRRLA